MTSMQSSDGQDAERDAVLLVALRHAPDAEMEPPTSVSTRILAQASAATRGSANAASRSWRETLAGWFAPRAPWAAAFGTVAAATLAGVLWSSRQLPAEDTAAATPPASEAIAAPASPPIPNPPSVDTPPKPAADAPAPARARAVSPEAQSNAVPAEKARPPPADAGAPATAAAPRPSAAEAARRSPLASMLRDPRGDAPAAASDPSVRLDAALRAAAIDAAVWRHAGRVHAHGSEQRLWWSQVGDATQGRWQAANEVRGDLPSAWMVLSIAGERTAAFWFVGDMLWLRDRAGVWRVPVSAEQRRTWQAAPQRW
jgi:hypothetical protein